MFKRLDTVEALSLLIAAILFAVIVAQSVQFESSTAKHCGLLDDGARARCELAMMAGKPGAVARAESL